MAIEYVDSTQLDSDLTSVADAIRAKSGGSSQLAFPAGFVNEIQAIPSGISGSAIELKDIQYNTGDNANMVTKAVVHGARILSNMLTQYGNSLPMLKKVTAKNLEFADTITAIEPYGVYYSALIPIVSFPEVTSVGRNAFEAGGAANFQKVTSVYLPKVTSLLANTFRYQKSMTMVQIGSVGHAVTSINSTAFKDCTQSGLTITVYVDDNTTIPLANAPWGATAATIVYRSSSTGEVRT